MLHIPEMLSAWDREIPGLLSSQIMDGGESRFGGFMLEEFHVDPRSCGFVLSRLIVVYLTPASAFYKSEKVGQAIQAAFLYMEKHQRPGGCYDLSNCNFASAPDTAFMVNALLNAWWLYEKTADQKFDWLKEPFLRLIDTAATGIMNGGFHTPNHRWAIASCLLSLTKITGRKELKARAQDYLEEGLDLSEDGEFAERSAGNYNQVNDDQMIRLYLATQDHQYLLAAKRNLEMMYCYIDPDGSVFTNNSTRQDLGEKIYTGSYYKLYLLVGYLLKEPQFGAMAEWIYQDAKKRGQSAAFHGDGLEWLLLFPEMDGYGASEVFDPPMLSYQRLFPASNIARVRSGDFSYTLLKGKPNCFYFQSGAFSVYMNIYANVCDRRHFIADKLEQTENGYRMTSRSESWYYLPFEEKPATSDWWAMDNVHTRKRMEGLALNMSLEAVDQPGGVDLHLVTDGLDQVPLRIEFSFLPDCSVRTEHFIVKGHGGLYINVLDGMVEAMSQKQEVITVGPAFCAHDVTSRMGGAYPRSDKHVTVYFTAYTPVDRVISLRTQPLIRRL